MATLKDQLKRKMKPESYALEENDGMTKAEAKYRPSESIDEQCGVCVHYSADKCDIVSGRINSKYVCDHFSAAPKFEPDEAEED